MRIDHENSGRVSELLEELRKIHPNELLIFNGSQQYVSVESGHFTAIMLDHKDFLHLDLDNRTQFVNVSMQIYPQEMP